MPRTPRPWTGARPLALAGLLLCGATASADEPAPLSDQLLGLGRQALAQGHRTEAASFLSKALEIDPTNSRARELLADSGLLRVALQEPGAGAPPPPAPGVATDATLPPPAPGLPVDGNAPQPGAVVNPAPAPGVIDGGVVAPAETPAQGATLEQASELDRVLAQQLTTDIRERQQRARNLLNDRQPQAALTQLRLAQNAIQAAQDVPENVRKQLTREVQAQIQATVRREELIEMERTEALRVQATAAQRARTIADEERTQETLSALMTQFDMLMSKGQYNVLYSGGLGDISASTAPFYDARLVAQQARALAPGETAPRAGILVSQYVGFLAQSLQFEEIKEYRAMLTWQDVDRAAIPFPDTITIEYPPAEHWREISEKRIRRYETVSLSKQDQKTKDIYDKLDQPITMPFGQDTPLIDVIKYIKSATESPELPEGIPIYLDRIGLQEAEKTEQDPVQLDLAGVPLKQALRLILKQLDLTYTVKDGLMTITYIGAKDQPTEIRVYPVADLAMIPISLMMGGMGGGMGGMGGGMGGMGGGMGGMGGGMGGMGGGMGGMGMGGMGGGMGGMRSMPIAPAQDPAADTASFLQKKRN